GAVAPAAGFTARRHATWRPAAGAGWNGDRLAGPGRFRPATPGSVGPSPTVARITQRCLAFATQRMAGVRLRARGARHHHVAPEPGPDAHPGHDRRGAVGRLAAGWTVAVRPAEFAPPAEQCEPALAPRTRPIVAPSTGRCRTGVGVWPDPAGHGAHRLATRRTAGYLAGAIAGRCTQPFRPEYSAWRQGRL